MKKRINSTGRRKLESEQIDIRINSEGGTNPVSFQANLEFSAMSDLDKNAKVYIEPYVRTSSMRFDFGTLSKMKAPPDTRLSELDVDGSLLFRVKVVDETGVVGRILAGASGIHARNTDDDGFNRKALLPLRTTDLGEAIWRLSYDSASGPVLEITNKIAGFSSKIQNDPLLRGAIYPHAFRELLRRLLDEPPDSELNWAQNWYAFVNALTGRDLLEDEPDDDESEIVIAEIVSEFCATHQIATIAAKFDEVIA